MGSMYMFFTFLLISLCSGEKFGNGRGGGRGRGHGNGGNKAMPCECRMNGNLETRTYNHETVPFPDNVPDDFDLEFTAGANPERHYDRCQFGVFLDAEELDDGSRFLRQVLFKFGLQDKPRFADTYERGFLVGDDGLYLWGNGRPHDSGTEEITSGLPYTFTTESSGKGKKGDSNSVAVTLDMKDDYYIITSEDCPWRLVFRLDDGPGSWIRFSVADFYTTRNNNGMPMTGLCGECLL